MITELCPRCWLYHAPEADCKAALAQGQAWLVKPPVDGWTDLEESGATGLAESQAPEPSEPGDDAVARINPGTAPKRRGRPPKNETRTP